MNTASDILTARAFRAQAVYFRRIGDGSIAEALIEAANALAPAEPAYSEPLDEPVLS